MKEIINAKGYVIRASAYKESDAMVTVLTNNNLYSFLARGIEKAASKNHQSCQNLYFSEFSLTKNGDKYSLKESKPIKTCPPFNDFESALALSLIGEICSKIANDEDASELFTWLDASIERIRNGIDPITISLIFFAHSLRILGSGLNISSCVRCGSKKNIVGVDYLEGGFVCKNCMEEGLHIYDSLALKTIRYAFLCPIDKMGDVILDSNICYNLLVDFCKFLEDNTGLRLKTIDMIKNMSNI